MKRGKSIPRAQRLGPNWWKSFGALLLLVRVSLEGFRDESGIVIFPQKKTKNRLEFLSLRGTYMVWRANRWINISNQTILKFFGAKDQWNKKTNKFKLNNSFKTQCYVIKMSTIWNWKRINMMKLKLTEFVNFHLFRNQNNLKG